MKHHVSFDLDFRENTYPGKLIVVEGVDGSGKTTQAKEIVKRLNKEGYNASYTKEPTDMIIGQFIREKILSGNLALNPLALQYLFNADRVMHMEKLEALLQKGMVIVMDRYFWSSVAYAMADLPVVSDWSLTAFSILSFYNQFIYPDFSFLLKVRPEIAMGRIEKSGKHTEIYDTAEKLLKVKNTYENLMKEFPDAFTVIDAERNPEEVTNDIVSRIKTQLPKP